MEKLIKHNFMPRYTQREIKEFEEMKRGQFIEKGEIERELDIPADLIVVDRFSRRVESVLVWGENGTLTDIARIKRLVERENASYGVESEVVVVIHRSVGMGDILQEQDIIKL